MDEKIRINVGGTLFITQQETLQSYPQTRLASLDINSSEYDASDKTYYFDRDPEGFTVILNMYRLKELHIPKHLCAISMRKEMEFWRIPQECISRCCWKIFYEVDEDMDILDELAKRSEEGVLYSSREKNGFKEKLWDLLNDPSSSRAAKIWHYCYLLVVMVSCLVLCLETLPTLRTDFSLSKIQDRCHNRNDANIVITDKIIYTFCLDALPSIFYTGVVCVVLFTAENLLSFCLCPCKKQILKNKLFLTTIITTLAMWCAIYIELNKKNIFNSISLNYIYAALKCISMLRVFLFFRLVRLFDSLNVLILAIKSSMRELLLLIVTILLATLVFAMIMYHAEFLHETSMPDMFASMWWAVITMTTVGYGDMYPLTVQGKLLGSLCCIFGLLLMALPVAIVASNFADYYNRAKDRKRHMAAKISCNKIKPFDNMECVDKE